MQDTSTRQASTRRGVGPTTGVERRSACSSPMCTAAKAANLVPLCGRSASRPPFPPGHGTSPASSCGGAGDGLCWLRTGPTAQV
eukprot:3601557-Alexandrium_andersonii.AAC.1